MNFPQVRAFHMAAREGGVARAAALLGVSQPTISQHIKALEAHYGVKLFERRGRSLALTPAGRDLLSVTDRLMQAAEEVDGALRRPAALTGGRLKIMADSTALAVELLRRFRAEHPSVELSLGVASVGAIVESLQDGLADAGVAVDPPAGDVFQIEPLRRERLYVTACRGHRFERMGRAPVSDLADETVIMREEGSRTRALVQLALEAEGVAPADMIEISERSAIREAVAARMGVAFFVRSECPPDPRLCHVPLAETRARLEFQEYLVTRRDRRRQPVIAACRAIAKRLAAEPWPSQP